MIKKLKRHGIIVFAVGLFLLITGLWFIINPYPAVKLPDEEPIAYLSIKDDRIEKEIEVLEDGTVIQVLKESSDADEVVSLRIWKKGLLTEDEQATLSGYLQSEELRTFDDLCEYPLPAYKGAPAAASKCTLGVRFGDNRKTVVAVIPHGSDGSWLHPDAPYPWNEIYLLLIEFGDSTLEIFREENDS